MTQVNVTPGLKPPLVFHFIIKIYVHTGFNK